MRMAYAMHFAPPTHAGPALKGYEWCITCTGSRSAANFNLLGVVCPAHPYVHGAYQDLSPTLA